MFFLSAVTIAVSGQVSLYKVESLPFNSPAFNEIAPVIMKDGILFCSDRRVSSISYASTYQDEKLYNIFFASHRDTARWGKPEEVKGVGSQLLYYGPVSIASDGKTIYFTSSIIGGKAARKRNIANPLGIFIGELSGRDISNIRPFEYNSQQYNIAHPSISRDGKFLYFSSNMPGGQGLSDIYYCENVNGKWTNPVNLGGKVNSASRENYPYIHPSGRLYFTSDRPSGSDFMGGMDVYYTSLIYGEWDTPVALPAPINSKSDDFAFVAEENLLTGYFSRKTGRNDDIWKFISTIRRLNLCDSMQVNSYCFEFFEENALKFDTIPFRYIWNFGDGTNAEGTKTIHCFKDPGRYIVTIDVVNLVTSEIQKAEKTFDLNITPIEQPYISGPDECTAGQQLKFNADSTYLPGWDITQYYWNFGDETVQTGKEVTGKVYLNPGTYNIQLIVSTSPDVNGVIREACVSKNINVIRKP